MRSSIAGTTAIAAVLGTAAVAFARPAAADQVSDLQAQAAQVSQALIREQLELGGYEQQYTAATQRVNQDNQLVSETQARIDEDQQRVASDRDALTHEAVLSYITGADSSGVSPIFTANQRNTDSQSQYTQAAVGQGTVTIAQLHTDENTLGAEEDSLRRVEADDQASQSQAATLVQQSQATQDELAQQSADVNGRLAAAIAQQQAAEAAAAAAAVRAAQEQAAAHPAAQSQSQNIGAPTPSSSSSSTSTPSTPSAPQRSAPATVATSSTDPALNPFLQCVVQHESGGDYGVVSPDGQYMGAFQFDQSTWNEAAQLAGRSDLVGVAPNQASPADQDTLAVALYSADGSQPWYDPCSN